MKYRSFSLRTWGMAALLVLLTGCGDRRDEVMKSPNIVDRAKLGEELLYVDSAQSVVHAVSVMSSRLEATAQRIEIPDNPRLAIERPGASEVLVLCSGARDSAGEWVSSPAFVAIDAKHRTRTYELTTALSKVEMSKDGRFAVLYAPDSVANGTDLLSDPNRVAVVDLTREPSDSNPIERTLKSSGGALTSAYVTQEMNVGGAARYLGLFSFSNGISVWDLSNPKRPDIASEGLGVIGQVTLRRIVEDPSHGALYFIQQGLSDLRVLSLGSAASGQENDFWPSWNQLPLDSTQATDLMLYGDDTPEPRVLVAANRELRVVDSNDSRVTAIAVSAPVGSLHRFEGTAPDDHQSKLRVLGWSVGSNTATFIDLADLESRGTRNTEVISLGSALQRVVSLSPTRVLTEFSSGGIGVLDLESRRFSPLASSLTLTSALIESDAKRVWVGANGEDRVAYFEPNTLHTASMRLDAAVEELFVFEQGAKRRVVVSHQDPFGELTVIDANRFSRAKATVLEGFLLDGLVK